MRPYLHSVVEVPLPRLCIGARRSLVIHRVASTRGRRLYRADRMPVLSHYAQLAAPTTVTPYAPTPYSIDVAPRAPVDQPPAQSFLRGGGCPNDRSAWQANRVRHDDHQLSLLRHPVKVRVATDIDTRGIPLPAAHLVESTRPLTRAVVIGRMASATSDQVDRSGNQQLTTGTT